MRQTTRNSVSSLVKRTRSVASLPSAVCFGEWGGVSMCGNAPVSGGGGGAQITPEVQRLVRTWKVASGHFRAVNRTLFAKAFTAGDNSPAVVSEETVDALRLAEPVVGHAWDEVRHGSEEDVVGQT